MSREVFEKWSDGFDHDSNEWEDMGRDEVFDAGFLAGQKAATQWRDISEAPKDGTEIVGIDMSALGGRYVGILRWSPDYPDEGLDAGWFDDCEGEADPTRWQPLP